MRQIRRQILEVADILSEYSNEMRISGYVHQFRAEIIRNPLFRPRFFERARRRKNKLMAQQSWYRAQCDIIGFLPPTPGAKLLSGIQQIVREEGEKIGLKM